MTVFRDTDFRVTHQSQMNSQIWHMIRIFSTFLLLSFTGRGLMCLCLPILSLASRRPPSPSLALENKHVLKEQMNSFRALFTPTAAVITLSIFTDWKRTDTCDDDRHRQTFQQLLGSPKRSPEPGLNQVQARNPTAMQASHMACTSPSTGAVTGCLPARSLPASWL